MAHPFQGNTMSAMIQEAFAIYARKMSERTVWIVQLPSKDGYVAVRLDGTEVCRGTHASHVDSDVKKLAADPENNIWAVCVVTNPKKRIPNRGPNKIRPRGYGGRYV